MILIDTDVAVDLLRGHAPAHDWLHQLPNDESISISGHTLIELYEGARNLDEVRTVKKWISKTTVLWLSAKGCDDAVEAFALRKLSHNLSAPDALIGFTAVEYGLTLHTYNAKHLSLISGIQIAQPYVRS